MAFSDWDSYPNLLDRLAGEHTSWADATDFASFDEKVRQRCASLVPDAGGYQELVTKLNESGDYDTEDELFEHLRIVLFAAPADVADLGEDWAGYWVSRNDDDIPIYAESRTASTDAWTVLVAEDEEETDETLEAVAAEPQDLREQHFDDESGRWRRWSESDSEFEYYHDEDAVWERTRDDLWCRYHDGAGEWLPYDGPSDTWLYQDAWVAYDRIGAPPAESDDEEPIPEDEAGLMELAERMIDETLAELEDEIEPMSAEDRAAAIQMLRDELAERRA